MVQLVPLSYAGCVETDEHLAEGWYLMSVKDLEIELARLRTGAADSPPSNAQRLSIADALAFRDAGNLPDQLGRTLRLVLEASTSEELRNLHVKRAAYEPDFHDPPHWRRDGSLPVNVVPLRRAGVEATSTNTWLDDPEVRDLEDEWRRTGCIAGMPVPAEYRGFVHKTVLSLRSTGRQVTPEAVIGSVTRWLGPEDVDVLRRALGSS